jgi:hypothetical protein
MTEKTYKRGLIIILILSVTVYAYLLGFYIGYRNYSAAAWLTLFNFMIYKNWFGESGYSVQISFTSKDTEEEEEETEKASTDGKDK